MNKQVSIPIELPMLRFPKGVSRRLQQLLDKQDRGDRLTAAERREAEGLVELSQLVALLKLRAERISRQGNDIRTEPDKPKSSKGTTKKSRMRNA